MHDRLARGSAPQFLLSCTGRRLRHSLVGLCLWLGLGSCSRGRDEAAAAPQRAAAPQHAAAAPENSAATTQTTAALSRDPASARGSNDEVAPPPPPPAATAPATYVLTGDLPEIATKGTIRFLVRGGLELLPRAGDPRLAEEEIARAYAGKAGLTPVFIPTASLDDMVVDLNEGRGDVAIAALAITELRKESMAFTRPIRHVAEVVVVRSSDTSVNKLEDLSGKEVTVRATSSYATTLAALAARVPEIKIKPAPETEDTISLIQRVARGEEQITIADSDILEATTAFEPAVRAAFTIADKRPIAWGVRKEATALKASLDAFLVERALSSHKSYEYRADLDEIKKRGVLRVLTRNSSTCYFIYRGEELGFEYELARELARQLGVRLELAIPPSRDALFEWLAAGKGDLIAAGLTITKDRSQELVFSEPYNTASELLVVPASDTTTISIADLVGKSISVRKSSSYYESLLPLVAKYGFKLDLLPEEMETESILKKLAQGEIAATVADSNIVELELTFSSAIRSVGPLGEPRSIAWVMRRDQPALKQAADEFHKKMARSLFYNLTHEKYFKNPKVMKAAVSDARTDREGRLSPYDDLVKKYAKRYELDWRLVCAQMYEESRFDPSARSWVGALGLMQVMPTTARELEIDDVVDPEGGIHAGSELLWRYAKMFASPSVREKDRIRFALAAYNAGPGHVIDARRLAADLKLDPNRWFGHVEKAMLLLSDPKYARKARHGYCRCDEPVRYVSEIQTRYDNYARLAKLE